MNNITFKNDKGEKYHLEVNELNENVITAGSKERIESISKYLNNVEKIENSRGLTIINGEYQEVNISCVTTGMGPASTSIVLPEIIESCKKDNINLLRLGTAGGLQEKVSVGDLVIVEGCIRDETTTTSIVDKNFPAITSWELIPVMINCAKKEGYKLGNNLHKGITHTKNDFYFKEIPSNSPLSDESSNKLGSYVDLGCLTTSMEFSVYSILKQYYENVFDKNILIGCLHSVLAKPLEEEKVVIDKKEKEEVIKDMIKISLEILYEVDKIGRNELINEYY